MVCRQCRLSASFASEEKVIYQHLDGRPQEMMAGWEASVLMHAYCKGGTWCDCQHKPPKRPVPAAGAAPTLDK